jgi:hypothetical protein
MENKVSGQMIEKQTASGILLQGQDKSTTSLNVCGWPE